MWLSGHSAGIPLAWLQLTREKRRFAAALAGIAFAVVLMLAQLGFQDALLSSVALLHSNLAGDLVLINPQYQSVIQPKTLTERRLYQALGSRAVASVDGVYLGVGPFKNPFDRTERDIFTIAFKPTSAVLNRPGIAENLDKIRNPGMVLFDSIRRPEFGRVAEAFSESGPVIAEVAGRRIEIVGLFQLGTSFGADGNLVMSDETFVRLFPFRTLGLINIGLITLQPGQDPERARAEISGLLPPDVRVLTHEEFVDLERRYWTTNTPIGFVFQLGVLMGLFVGCIIVYQILYSDVTDHLPEYATLKAMGYPDRFLLSVVLQEAAILSVLGFIPGAIISHLVYVVSRNATLLPLEMTWRRALVVYALTLGMCGLSAALAARRLKAADPAEIF
jgi:putative ABC transport system permease protein